MNKRLIYGALSIIIRLLLHITRAMNVMPPSLESDALELSEELEAVADGRMNE